MLGNGHPPYPDLMRLNLPHCFLPPRASPRTARTFAPCSHPSRAHLRRSLLTPHSRQSCALPAPLAPRSGHAGPTPSCSTRRSLRQAKRPVPMVVVLARRRIPSRRPKLIGPAFPSIMLQMYISSVSDVSEACCNYFIWMLQK
jgi:hypothetical protein